MENETNFIEPLFERVEEYGKTSYVLFKLKAIEKTTSTLSTLVSRSLVVLFFSLSLLIANIGVALWLGDILGKSYYGFFCVALFYGFIGGIFYFCMHKWIKKRIGNSIISQLLK